MSTIKRDHVKTIMDMYFLGHLSKEEMYAMVESIKNRRYVAIYCRVDGGGSSEARQEALAAQRTKLVDYARQQGFLAVRFYEDSGLPGNDSERPGLTQLLHDYAAGTFDAVLVVNRDRLYRGARHEEPEWDFEVLTPLE